ncbi:hypothetical protein GCM10010124_37080 [Pilimelia terevasa]|uniref:Uncharacterized protein n=1 Tax=Pilimelia terevasa TaxID=53372 RepID=A0A8J3FJK6_9ACTN|nr:hypothetical protein [Pilimelia terevasa]GGK40816.1 hypothetical protein GCM10010124_37080 [Pilimelia terevasa]
MQQTHLLALADAVLQLGDVDSAGVHDLEALLRSCGSELKVVVMHYESEFLVVTMLARRVDSTVQAAFEEAVVAAAGTDAAEHLSRAWVSAYGLNPHPDQAYLEAVKAVEVALGPLVAPSNNRRTLGSTIRDLLNQQGKWELVFVDAAGQPADPKPLVDLLNVIWHGHARHGGAANSRVHSQEEAESVVHLAATVVQWVKLGALHRVP